MKEGEAQEAWGDTSGAEEEGCHALSAEGGGCHALSVNELRSALSQLRRNEKFWGAAATPATNDIEGRGGGGSRSGGGGKGATEEDFVRRVRGGEGEGEGEGEGRMETPRCVRALAGNFVSLSLTHIHTHTHANR